MNANMEFLFISISPSKNRVEERLQDRETRGYKRSGNGFTYAFRINFSTSKQPAESAILKVDPGIVQCELLSPLVKSQRQSSTRVPRRLFEVLTAQAYRTML